MVTKLFLPGCFTDDLQTMSRHCADIVWFGSGTSQDVLRWHFTWAHLGNGMVFLGRIFLDWFAETDTKFYSYKVAPNWVDRDIYSKVMSLIIVWLVTQKESQTELSLVTLNSIYLLHAPVSDAENRSHIFLDLQLRYFTLRSQPPGCCVMCIIFSHFRSTSKEFCVGNHDFKPSSGPSYVPPQCLFKPLMQTGFPSMFVSSTIK